MHKGEISMNNQRVTDYLFSAADSSPESPAIYLPDTNFITYKQLAEQINLLASELTKGGFADGQRIAIIMPHCLEAVLAFYAATLVATAVPLNPSSSVDELKQYMKLAKVEAIIVNAGYSGVVQQAAAEMAIPVVLMERRSKESFQFLFDGVTQKNFANAISHKNVTAVVLFTSGTTSTPKVVPLTHANLIKTVETTKEIFDLHKDDRAISVTPLFHIYGIVGPILSAAATSSSVICLPAFRPQEFFHILQAVKITWYAASPAIHYAVAEYAEKINADKDDYDLRLIRSGSAPLPLQLIEKLKSCFGAVVVQGYGLTETAGLATCNSPLLGKIKNESVGKPTGCEIAIMDEQGNFLPPSVAGEIVIRGESVTKGYENIDSEERIFLKNGWFRSGDQGYFDEEGFLFITGRIKEIINRGGVKISPYEVENVILQWPEIKEAAVFAIPHASLGEMPAAMIVLNDNQKLAADQLASFLKSKLTIDKLPVKVYFASQIPKSPNGKIQRRGLYQYIKEHQTKFEPTHLGSSNISDRCSAKEKILAEIWCKLLKIENLDEDEDFFDAGGDSLLAAELFAEIDKKMQIDLPVDTIISYHTFGSLAAYLRKEHQDSGFDFIVPMKKTGRYNPLFCIHNINGDTLVYRKLANDIDKEQPLYGLTLKIDSPQIIYPLTFEHLASLYAEEMQRIQPEGPYYIAGHSLGGIIAFEAARCLQAKGQEIALLAMFDTWLITKTHHKSFWERNRHSYRKFAAVPFKQTFSYLQEKIMKEIERWKTKRFMQKYNHTLDAKLDKYFLTKAIIIKALQNYQGNSYAGDIHYFYAKDCGEEKYSEMATEQWRKRVSNVKVIEIAGSHAKMLEEPEVYELADKLNDLLAETRENLLLKGEKT